MSLNSAKQTLPPPSLKVIIFGSLAFVIWFIVSQFFTLMIFVPLPFKRKKRKAILKQLLRWYGNFIWSIQFNISKKISGQWPDLKKPMIVLCNHQTIFDVPATLMITSHFLVVTNNWLGSTIFRYIIDKYVEHISVSIGVDNAMLRIKERVTEGESILLFPEGIRYGDTVGRFHKGAFLLAEHLKMDILPVIMRCSPGIHAPKPFFFKSGKFVMKFGEPIRNDDVSWGADYSERAKNVCRYFREEYERIKEDEL